MPPAQHKQRYFTAVEWPKEIKDQIVKLADEVGCSPPYILRLCYGQAIQEVARVLNSGEMPDDPLRTGVARPLGPTTPLPLATFMQTGAFVPEPETEPEDLPEPVEPAPLEESASDDTVAPSEEASEPPPPPRPRKRRRG